MFIKALEGKLTSAAQDSLLQAEDCYLSTISIWEIAIKHRLGKLDFPANKVDLGIHQLALDVLAFTTEHAKTLYTLALGHKDPFDRALIGIAIAERLTLITTDSEFHRYLPFGLDIIEAE